MTLANNSHKQDYWILYTALLNFNYIIVFFDSKLHIHQVLILFNQFGFPNTSLLFFPILAQSNRGFPSNSLFILLASIA
jgi:hypothetical protein